MHELQIGKPRQCLVVWQGFTRINSPSLPSPTAASTAALPPPAPHISALAAVFHWALRKTKKQDEVLTNAMLKLPLTACYLILSQRHYYQ